MNNLKKILAPEELRNLENVKEYLKFSFKRRRTKKDYKVYINIAKIFDYQPELIKELLDNIPKLGYYKDYFHILCFSRNKELKTYIYDLVFEQMSQDIKNIKINKKISTLGKWLPKEGSKIDKRTNFVREFSVILFPEFAIASAMKRYRLLKTMFNKKLNTLEAKMCAKDYNIDYEKVSPNALRNNIHNLIKHEECKKDLEDFRYRSLLKLDLEHFVSACFVNNVIEEKRLYEEIWKKNMSKYLHEIPYLSKFIKDAVIIIDLSNKVFKYEFHNFTIGVALLADSISLLKNKIFISDDSIKLEGNLNEKINTLMNYCGPISEIDFRDYYNKIIVDNDQIKNVLIVSCCELTNFKNINFLGEKKINLMQIRLKENKTFDIIHYNGDKIRTFSKFNNHDQIQTVKQRIIEEILEKYKSRNIFVISLIPFSFLILVLAYIGFTIIYGISGISGISGIPGFWIDS